MRKSLLLKMKWLLMLTHVLWKTKWKNSKTAWRNYDLYVAPTKFRYLIQIFDHPVHGINFNRLKLQIQLKGITLSTFSLLFS